MDSLTRTELGHEDITIEHLRRSVVNEIASPELLPFEKVLFEHYSSLLKEVHLLRSCSMR